MITYMLERIWVLEDEARGYQKNPASRKTARLAEIDFQEAAYYLNLGPALSCGSKKAAERAIECIKRGKHLLTMATFEAALQQAFELVSLMKANNVNVTNPKKAESEFILASSYASNGNLEKAIDSLKRGSAMIR